MGGPLKPASRVAELRVVQRFFSFLAKQGLILMDPAAELVVPKASPLPRAVLTLTQTRRLMSAPAPSTVLGRRDRAILELLYGTGIRLSECTRLDLPDLDLSRGLLLVRDGKGRRDRYVPVAGQAAAAVDLYLRRSRPELVRHAEPALFLSRQARRLSRVRLPRLVKEHGRRIGVEISTHSLRHARATHLLRGGADIRHVQAILGHRQLESTAIYTRVEVADLRKVLRRCHPRERGVRCRQ
jgi:integrase/recombinase XerD